MPNSDSAPPMNCAPGPNSSSAWNRTVSLLTPAGPDEERIDLPRAAGWRAARPEHCRRDGAAIDVRDVRAVAHREVRRERERFADVSLELQQKLWRSSSGMTSAAAEKSQKLFAAVLAIPAPSYGYAKIRPAPG